MTILPSLSLPRKQSKLSTLLALMTKLGLKTQLLLGMLPVLLGVRLLGELMLLRVLLMVMLPVRAPMRRHAAASRDPDLTYRGNYSLHVLHIVEYTS
jgi:hypothetical protein